MQRCIESHSHGDLYIVTALRPHWFGFSQKSQQSHSSRAVDGRCRRCMTALQGSRTGSTDGLRQRSLAGMLSLWYCQTSKWDKRYILIFEIFKKCRTVSVCSFCTANLYLYSDIFWSHRILARRTQEAAISFFHGLMAGSKEAVVLLSPSTLAKGCFLVVWQTTKLPYTMKYLLIAN